MYLVLSMIWLKNCSFGVDQQLYTCIETNQQSIDVQYTRISSSRTCTSHFLGYLKVKIRLVHNQFQLNLQLKYWDIDIYIYTCMYILVSTSLFLYFTLYHIWHNKNNPVNDTFSGVVLCGLLQNSSYMVFFFLWP